MIHSQQDIHGVSGNYVHSKRVDRGHCEHHFDIGHSGSETPPKDARALSSLRLKVGSQHSTLAGKVMKLCHFGGLRLSTWALAPQHDDKDPTSQRRPNMAMWAQHGDVDQTW